MHLAITVSSSTANMVAWCLLINSLLSGSALVSAYKRIDNSDFYGNDIFSVGVLEANKCVEACAKVPTCRAATWWDSQCYLKTKLSNETFKLDTISYVMYPEDLTCINSFTVWDELGCYDASLNDTGNAGSSSNAGSLGDATPLPNSTIMVPDVTAPKTIETPSPSETATPSPTPSATLSSSSAPIIFEKGALRLSLWCTSMAIIVIVHLTW